MDAARTVAELAAEPQQLLDALSEEERAELLGELERLRALVWARLSRPPEPSGNGVPREPETGDRMLKAAEVAEILDVPERWVYDHHDELPFARKLAPRTNRYSERGLYRWLQSRA